MIRGSMPQAYSTWDPLGFWVVRNFFVRFCRKSSFLKLGLRVFQLLESHFQTTGFRVQGSGFRVRVLGFRV